MENTGSFLSKKQIIGIVVIVIIILSIIVGVYLVQRQQNLKSKASGIGSIGRLADNFESGLSAWQVIYPTTSTTDISIKNGVGYNSNSALSLNYSTNTLSLRKTLMPTATNMVAKVFFYDNLQPSLGSVFASADNIDPRNPAANQTYVGVITNVNPNTYTVKIYNPTQQTYDSKVARVKGWNLFEIVTTDQGTFVKINGNLVKPGGKPLGNLNQKSVQAVFLASSWVAGEALYDDVEIMPMNTSPWQEQLWLPFEYFYQIYKDTNFYLNKDLSSSAGMDYFRTLSDTAINFYLYGKHANNQEAINKARALFMQVLNKGDWKRMKVTNQICPQITGGTNWYSPTCNPSNWLRGLHMAEFAYASYLMWGEFDFATQAKIKQMITEEADLYLSEKIMPPFGNSSNTGDTKGEENAWNAEFLAIAANLFPGPNVSKWEERAKCFAYHSITTSQDPAFCGVKSQTAQDNFEISNHGTAVNPVYAMSILYMLSGGGLSYQLAGKPIPEEFKHNVKAVYEKLLSHVDRDSYHYNVDLGAVNWSGQNHSIFHVNSGMHFIEKFTSLPSWPDYQTFYQKKSLFYNKIPAVFAKDQAGIDPNLNPLDSENGTLFLLNTAGVAEIDMPALLWTGQFTSEQTPLPVNGSCSPTHYNCSAGITGTTAEYANQWQWWCNGKNGGTKILCAEMKSVSTPTGIPSIASSPTIVPTTSPTTAPTNQISEATFNEEGLNLKGMPATLTKLDYQGNPIVDVPVIVKDNSGNIRTLVVKFNYTPATTPTSVPAPTTTAGPCVGEIHFDTVANNTTFTAGSKVNLAGWSAFCSGPNGTNRDRVDLHLLNKATNTWTQIAGGIPSAERKDVITNGGACNNGNPNTGWSYNWTVPNNTPGNFILRAVSINDPATTCNKIIDRNITIVTASSINPTSTPIPPTPTPIQSGPTPTRVPSATNTPIPSNQVSAVVFNERDLNIGGTTSIKLTNQPGNLIIDVPIVIHYSQSGIRPLIIRFNYTPTSIAVNGSCSPTHYNCSAGTTGATAEYDTQWQWWCNGIDGGANTWCYEMKEKPPSR